MPITGASHKFPSSMVSPTCTMYTWLAQANNMCTPIPVGLWLLSQRDWI